jgi:hypothetical protein
MASEEWHIIPNMARQREPEILSRPANRKTPARMAVFLRIYAECGRVNVAAKAAGIARCTHYRKLATDAKYREAFDQAEHEAARSWRTKRFDEPSASVSQPRTRAR